MHIADDLVRPVFDGGDTDPTAIPVDPPRMRLDLSCRITAAALRPAAGL